MVPWYYMLVTLGLGLQIGDWVCDRRWRKERDAEFDRAIDKMKGGDRD